MLRNFFIFAIGFVLAAAAGLTSLGAITKNKAPEVAVSLLPLNGFAAENIASRGVKAAVSENDGSFPQDIDPVVFNWARLAFLAESTTPVAVATLALNASEKNKRLLMQKAFALSRREQIVTGWMIADSSTRNDTQKVLHYFDTALRTNSSAAPVLIPAMVQALSNRDSVKPFADLLLQNPPWATSFWESVVAAPGALINGAILRQRVFRESENKTHFRDEDLIRALAYSQHFGMAERTYALFNPISSSNEIIKNSSFDREPEFAPLDWELMTTGQYGASVTEDGLELSAVEDGGGVFAKQLVQLPIALMQLEIEANATIPNHAKLVLEISCAEKLSVTPRPIRIPIKEKSTLRKISNQSSGCRYFWVKVVARASGQEGASAQGGAFNILIRSLSLRRG